MRKPFLADVWMKCRRCRQEFRLGLVHCPRCNNNRLTVKGVARAVEPSSNRVA